MYEDPIAEKTDDKSVLRNSSEYKTNVFLNHSESLKPQITDGSMNDSAEMDLLEEVGDEIHIKAEDISEFGDETQIEAVFFSDSLLHELKDENQMEAEVLSISDAEMEGNASTHQGLETLSDKSYNRYLSAYEVFKKWQESKETNSFAEPVLLDYFHELATKYKPSSLTLFYTMLKSTILYNQNINISEYSQLIEFLKTKGDRFQRKKPKLFTADDVNKFLVEAPDYKYLAMKVVLVFGVIGSCSIESITYVKIDHVLDNGKEIMVKILDKKTKVVKTHVIGGHFAEIVRKYLRVRPRIRCKDKFFMQYQDGKCINRAMGKNTLLKVPKQIAKFLKLPECEAYTGYSFRITSTSISADTSVGIETRHGQYKPSTVVEENVQESFGHERKMIADELNFTSTSNVIIGSHENASVRIAPATITSLESSSHVYEVISDESTGDITENNSLSENEDASTQDILENVPDNRFLHGHLYMYGVFQKWQELKEENSFAEPVLLDYFREVSEKYKLSSTYLWNLYAMLKPSILSDHNIDISEYSQLSKFLKEKSDGSGKKTKLFTPEDVTKFLFEAPDDEYLAMKTISVFALIAACSVESITYVETRYVEDNGIEIIVRIPDPRTKLTKAHVIDGQFAEIVRKYMKLRPRTAHTERFFMRYRNGKCTNQVIGKNTIAKVPKKIAKFLKLPEFESYGGSSFRITPTINRTIETLKRLEQRRSSSEAEGNVQQSLGHKRKSAEEINLPSTRNVITESHENTSKRNATDAIITSESSSLVYEISDESTGEPENNPLSEIEELDDSNDDSGLNIEQRTEVENCRNPPPLSYFESSDAALKETLPNKSSDTSFLHGFNENFAGKSHKKYVYNYEVFKRWQKSKGITSVAEPVLLDYFRELSTKYKPSTLLGLHTMLKCTILAYHKINISGYSRLLAFLKEKTEGFQSKKLKVFTADDVTKFLVEAPDDEYLAMKSVLVFALIGACSGDKIMSVMTDYVKDNGSEIIVRIPDAKTNVAKPHIIDGQFAEIIRKYIKLRPTTATTQRFFLQYRGGKCTDQVMGKRNVDKVPKEIAKFLKLPESETYTGYSFRSTSTRSSADTSEALKRYGQQRISGVAEENVQESSGYQGRIGTPIAETRNLPSTSNVINASHENASERIPSANIKSSESFSFVNEERIDESTTDESSTEEFSTEESTNDMSDNNSSSESEESSDSNDDTEVNPQHRTKGPKRRRKKRPKRQKEIDWYDEECQSQIKLTTDMFKRFSKMAENDKMKMLSEFSMDRVELFKKYFAAMNTVVRNPINTATAAVSINTAAQNGGVTDPLSMLP